MRKTFLIAALILPAYGGAVFADQLTLPPEGAAMTPTVATPARGMSMAAVSGQFGAPAQKHAPVGGASPQQPPITRWDYAEFSVFFERDKVIDVVVAGQPAQVRKTDELQPGE